MKGHTRLVPSGTRLALFRSLLGCLLIAVIAVGAGTVFQPALAARQKRPVASGQIVAVELDHSLWKQEMRGSSPAAEAQKHLHGTPLEGGSALELRDGTLSCRVVTEAEARAMRRDSGMRLQVLGNESLAPDATEQERRGLKIILRGTAQLEQYPEVKAAFLRAARRWESLIQNPITIVIDVDYGPMAFGQPFPENTYGLTRFQRGFTDTAYAAIRSAFIQSAGSPLEATLYNLLPAAELPTDLGASPGLIYHTPVLRALGLQAPVADPEAEAPTLGGPPTIAFNSAIDFDFDPSDGIGAELLDFNASAMHEIGHALGFFSGVGIKELFPDAPITPETADIFRFRPGVTLESFATAPRILSSGGEHIFFGGGEELPFSTGRGDSTGGDGRQAGHWKDDRLSGRYIGIMDPVFNPGVRYDITTADVRAFELIGYRMNPILGARETELQIDDAVIDGYAVGDGLVILNRLTPPGYPATLRKLRMVIPAVKNLPRPDGKPITLIIYAPNSSVAQLSQSQVLRRIETIVPSASIDLFLEFDIPDGPTIDSGDFWVGYQAPSPHDGVVFAVDLSGEAVERSFYTDNNGGGFLPLSNLFQGKTANAMMRAIVSIGGEVTSVSAASFKGDALASESIVAAFGAGLSTTVMHAQGEPGCPLCLPTELAGTRVLLRDSAGAEHLAPLFYVSPDQVNYLIPPEAALGPASVTITSGDGTVSVGTTEIASVAPGLFTANGSGVGAPAAWALRVKNGEPRYEPIVEYDSSRKEFVPRPIDLGEEGEQVFLILFGTGLRYRSALSSVRARIGNVEVPVLYAGSQYVFLGVDQVNLSLPRSLQGAGEVEVELIVDGKMTNRVRINIE